jgi:hypothetical protein
MDVILPGLGRLTTSQPRSSGGVPVPVSERGAAALERDDQMQLTAAEAVRMWVRAEWPTWTPEQRAFVESFLSPAHGAAGRAVNALFGDDR